MAANSLHSNSEHGDTTHCDAVAEGMGGAQYTCTSAAVSGTLLPPANITRSDSCFSSEEFCSSHDTACDSLARDPSGCVCGNILTMSSICMRRFVLAGAVILTEQGGQSTGTERHRRWRRRMRSGDPCRHPL